MKQNEIPEGMHIIEDPKCREGEAAYFIVTYSERYGASALEIPQSEHERIVAIRGENQF